MMYLLFSTVLAASAFAQSTPLLQLDQYSGYVQPQNAMEAHCSVEPFFDTTSGLLTAHVTSAIFRDRTGVDGAWKTQSTVDQVVTLTDYNQIQTWITEAEAGPFKQGANPCDIGTFTAVTQNYPLLVSKDCGKRIENQHPSAPKLIAWLRQACNLDGTKGTKR